MTDNDQRFQEFRKTFPAYSEGIYLNHAAVSPFSSITSDAISEYCEWRKKYSPDIFPDLVQIRDDLKSSIAKLIHAQGQELIAVTSNTSTGLNIIASGLPWREGDRIILNTIEFPANVYPFLNLERQGVVIDWVEPVRGRIDPEAIFQKLTSRTKMVSISHVQFTNGFRADLKTIGKWCSDHGIWFVVDGIQGVGAVPIDVVDASIDALSTGGHKWLMWPMGTAFLYTSRKMMEAVHPSHTGWLSVENPWELLDYKLVLPDSSDRFEPGTLNFMSMKAANSMALAFLDLSIEAIYSRIKALTDQLIEGIDRLGMELLTPIGQDVRSGIVSVKAEEPDRLLNYLEQSGISAASRQGAVRFSPHCTNRPEEIDALLRVLRGVRL